MLKCCEYNNQDEDNGPRHVNSKFTENVFNIERKEIIFYRQFFLMF